jgi:ADP-ribose pyrophosphatase YjhB (NUDIX family)
VVSQKRQSENGELVTTAAVRVAREEAGPDIRFDHLLNVYSYTGRAPVIIVYVATMTGGALAADDEGLKARWFLRSLATTWLRS